MNLEQIVKETVAKIVAEKELTAAEEKKREEIVKAMKKDFKGPAPAMYAIATDKAKKLAESDPQTIAKISNAIEAGKIDPKEVEAAALKASQGNADDLAILMVNAMAGLGQFRENQLAEDEDHEVSMAQNSLNSIIRSAMELKAKIGDQEINIPAWIQDHITNSENFIDQASQGYHEYSNGENNEMNELQHTNKNTMTTNEGRSAEDLKQIQLNMAQDHLENLKNSKYYGTKANEESIKKAEERIEKLSAELDALAEKSVNESFDETTVRRWQHYAGIK